MKNRSTTPVSKKGLATKAVVISAAIMMTVTLPTQILLRPAYADQFDDQIAAIQAQRDQYDAQAAALASQADTLDNQKAILQNQVDAIQAQVNESQAQYDKLQQQIADNEKKISDNRSALGQTIATMYVDDSMTPLELLASSSNIGDYINKQEYRSTIRDNLVKTIDKINTLKKELEQQRTDVERVLSDQKSQREALAVKVAELNKLITDTQNQEAAYQQLSAQGASQQNSLRQQQQEAIAAAIRANGGGKLVTGDPGRGGYPSNLANAPQDSIIDPWGMYNRECVSYVAWKVYQKNGYMPYWGGAGNASQWPANARASGIPTGSTPRVGAAGVIYAGPYGHIVWVDSINGDGTINISQYNYGYPMGQFSRMYNVHPSAYDVYIYF